MPLPVFHPLHALTALVAVTLVASLVPVAWPSYRRELASEAAQRVTTLDGLRGILCFSVMLHHAAITRVRFDTGTWDPPPSNVYTLMGGSAVAMFFCVTGFLFWSRAIASQGQIAAIPFMRARLARIAPLYLFSIALIVAVTVGEISWLSRQGAVAIARMGLLGMKPWGTPGGIDVSLVNAGVAWTLRYEWAFYLILPAMAGAARKGGLLVVGLFMLGVYVLMSIGPHLYFAIGMAAAYAAHSPRASGILKQWWVAVVVIGATCALPWLTSDGLGGRAIPLTAIIFIPIACGNTIFGLLQLRGLRLMGIASYSVYLLHGIGLHVCNTWLKKQAATSTGSYWLAIDLLAVGVLIISLATYRWIELPAINFEKRFRRSRSQFTDVAVKESKVLPLPG